MQLSMNEITTFRWSFDEDVENHSAAGYESIGVWLQKLVDYGEDRAIDLLAGSPLHVSNVVWSGGFTGSDGRAPSESVCETIRALRVCAALRAGCLVVYPGGRNNHTYRHAGRLLRNALDELLTVAEIVEVPLAIEPMHPACAAEWTFLTDLRATLDLLDEYGTPYLQLVLDTYHFPLAGVSNELMERVVEHLAIVHLGDRLAPPNIDQERCLLGSGNLPLSDAVQRLIEWGYDGCFDVKLMGPEIETTNYWTILHQSREKFAEMMGLFAPLRQ